MPSRNSIANACELASFSPNDTGPAWSAVRSFISHATPQPDADKSEEAEPCPGSAPYCLRNGNRRQRFASKRHKKGAAVAGGSKVITGRRQTEWTGATQCP